MQHGVRKQVQPHASSSHAAPAPPQVATQGIPRLALPLEGAYLLRLDRDGQPGIVPGQLARGITPPHIVLTRPERPQLHDRHRGVKPWGVGIPPVKPNVLAWAKRRAHRRAGVWWRLNVPLLWARVSHFPLRHRFSVLCLRCDRCGWGLF
jgi:hypothetical protein